MVTVSARDANQQFSSLLETAARGEQVTITRRGIPVARLVPITDSPLTQAELEVVRRREEILARFDEGYEGGSFADWTREELYERGDGG